MLNESISNKTSEATELDLVFVSNKQVLTDSLMVAKRFDKRHDHVLRSIRTLLKDNSDLRGLPKFEESSYINAQGKEQPKYLLTKDAMILLVMGYTGKEVMEFKLDYINAFNVMYDQVRFTAKLEEDLRVIEKLDQMSFEGASDAGRILRQRGLDKPVFKSKIERLKNQLQLPLDLEPKKIAH